MNRIVKNILFFTFSMFLVNLSFAQEDWEDGREIEDVQIVVEKNKKIELPVSSRKFEKIDNLKVEDVNTKQEFKDLSPSLLDLNQINPRLKVLKIKSERPSPLIGNYVEVGFGNYITPLLNAYFNSTRNSNYAYGAHINHISSKNGPVNYSGMSSSEIGINGDYFMDNAVFNGSLTYNNEAFRYYGFDSEIIPISDEKLIKQNLNQINGNAGVDGIYNNLTYDTDVIFSVLSGKSSLSDINYGYKSLFNYELADNSSINVSSELILENAKNDSFSVERAYFSLNPNYKFLHDGINITVGLNTAFDNDEINGGGKYHIYPNVFLNYPLFVNELNVFGGMNGELERNSFTSLINENRWFLMTENLVFNNDKKIEFFGGLKGNFQQKVGYKTQLSFKNYNNLHYFTNYANDTTQFTIVTDSGATILNFNGELSYDVSEKMIASLVLDYNSYRLSGLSDALYRPNLVLGVNASYTIQKKVRVTTQINYISGLKGYSIGKSKIVELNDIIDLNVGLDYKISNNFSTFVQLNNITNSNYSYFLNYQNKKFNGLVGVSYSF